MSFFPIFSTKTFFQVNGVLELDETPEGTARYSALDKWTTQLSQLQKIIVNRMT
jgi:COP9 signalosome complex subunit 2